MRYELVENNFQHGDEIYSANMNKWLPIDVDAYKYRVCLWPVRRLINEQKSAEVFSVPFGTWAGCTGDVFMDGTSKKVRLHNVFYGAKPLVIDFPARKMHGNNIVLEDDDVLQNGDEFSYTGGFIECISTVGMKVKDARKEFSPDDVYFIR